ncbi:MAG: NAD(P)/FAD-dependent oxidoreductase [Acidobacteriota bacterium]
MENKEFKLVIIGAGPAGLIAAIESFIPGMEIIVLEKMFKPALKLRISGKGRCNITNKADIETFISHFGRNGKFLRYPFSKFFNDDLLNYFENMGVKFKLERGGRYFPLKDDSLEIVESLLKRVKSLNIPVSTGSDVKSIMNKDNGLFEILIKKTDPSSRAREIKISSENILIATGGRSYPGTGSNGSGYILASQLGHTISQIRPALVPIITSGIDTEHLNGLTLRNVNVEVWSSNKKINEQFGEMAFTVFGVSGPVILSMSKMIVEVLEQRKKINLIVDLKPALEHKTLEKRLLREINNFGDKTFSYLLKNLLPKSMIPVFFERMEISGEKKLSQVTSDERKNLRMLLKGFRIEIAGYKSFKHAIVTSGGVNLNEIDSRTMGSKIIKGLYFAGEVINIDADTGGFNLQAAFSTGWLAGKNLKSIIGNHK